MTKIYIASPYSLGSEGQNVRYSMEAANELINEGYAPFCPLLNHFQNMVFPQEYEVWMEQDLEWLSVCDALLRLTGHSYGAEAEVEFARSNEIPVFYNINQITEYFNDTDNFEL